MKKTISIIASLVLSLSIQAQEVTNAETESTQTIEFGFPGGFTYTYEHAFAKKMTIIGRGGLTGAIGYQSINFNGEKEHYWQYSIHPYIECEPRYYYNLQKRAKKGKKTINNTGSFWALRTGYVFNPIVKHNVESGSGLYMVPCWGLRRSWGKHWVFEFEAGLALGWNNFNSSRVSPHLGVNFSYRL